MLRAIAREAGVPATSTVAVLLRLAKTGVITPEQHESWARTLIKARVGDMPLDEPRLLELAEDD